MSVSQSPRMLVAYTRGWGFSSSVLSCLIRWQMERLSHLNNPRSNACRCFELGKMEFWHLKALCLYVSWRSEQILSWTTKKKKTEKNILNDVSITICLIQQPNIWPLKAVHSSVPVFCCVWYRLTFPAPASVSGGFLHLLSHWNWIAFFFFFFPIGLDKMTTMSNWRWYAAARSEKHQIK